MRLVYDFGMPGAFFSLSVRLVRLVKDFGASMALSKMLVRFLVSWCAWCVWFMILVCLVRRLLTNPKKWE